MIFQLHGGPGNGQEVDLPPDQTHFLYAGEYWYAKKAGVFRNVTHKSTFEMIQREVDDAREHRE